MNALILLRDWQESQIEFWKPVEGFPGYDVSSFGRVRSWWCCKKGGTPGERCIGTAAKEVKPQRKQWHGYPVVHLYRPGQATVATRNGCQNRKQRWLHHLVAEAFVGNPEGYPEVNHRTGVKADNRAGNLEWSTRQQNVDHAKAAHGQSWGNHKGHRLSPSKAREIRARIANGEKYGPIAKDFGVGWRAIANVAIGKSYPTEGETHA